MIEKIGFIAAAWATLLAYGSMMFLSYAIGQKHYPIAYDLKKIVGYLVLSIVLSIAALKTNGNYYINTGLVFLFLWIAILLEKNEIKQLVKR